MSGILAVRRLTRLPKKYNGDEVKFVTGVNVMVGEKDSGKTTWLRMLDFLWGDDEKPLIAFGEMVALSYDTVEGEFQIGPDVVVLKRSWAEAAPKTKMWFGDELINVSDLSDLLLTKLSMPRVNFPKGDPYAERKWPALTFRTLLRHIYRQERFWSDIADRQPEVEQHACLALFLGVADVLFPAKYGELVKKQKQLEQLRYTREAHQSLLDQLAADLLKQKEMSVTVTDASIATTEGRLHADLNAIEVERSALLKAVAEKAEAHVSLRSQAAKAELDVLHQKASTLQEEEHGLAHRLAELKAYSQMLADEVARFGRAEAVNDLVAQLRVTHCPVCDQEVEPSRDASNCYLCHRPMPSLSVSTGKKRVEFEEAQLNEEKGEIESLIENLERKRTDVQRAIEESRREQSRLEVDLRPARQIALGLLPPDLALLDQRRGRLYEQLDTLARVRKSVESQNDLAKKIDEMLKEEARLKVELSGIKADADLQRVSAIFEGHVNDYLNQINVADPTRWKHRRVSFQLRERNFSFGAEEKLGATSQALLLFAYHYALLCLVAEPEFCYPGIVIIDFPLQLASGQTIRDKENYLVEPFVKLCANPTMNGSQFIAAGHSFDELTGANVIEVVRNQA